MYLTLSCKVIVVVSFFSIFPLGHIQLLTTTVTSYSTVNDMSNFIAYITFLPGAYVPMTSEGNILVDGVLASCYASVNHDLTHVGMTPVGWFPEIVKWIFNEDDGFSAFVRTTKQVCKSILPYGQLWH